MTTATAGLTSTTTSGVGGGKLCSHKRIANDFATLNTSVSSSNGFNCWNAATNHPRRRLVFAKASSSSPPPPPEKKQDQSDNDDVIDDDQKPSSVSVMKRLVDANPVGLGRRSRQIFDEAWRKFSELGQISRTTRTNDESSLLIQEGGPMCEFATPGAQNTTVLVVGATSRVGRIVVRKLMLRGYSVKVFLFFALPLLYFQILSDLT